MKYHKIFNFFNENISSRYFNEFIKKQIELDKKYDREQIYKMKQYYYLYEKLFPKKSFFYKTQKDFFYGWSYYNIISNNTLPLWEYDFKIENNYKICSMTNFGGLCNECFFYKSLMKNIKLNHYVLDYLTYDKEYFNNSIEKMKKIIKNLKVLTKEELTFDFNIIYVYYFGELIGNFTYLSNELINTIMALFSLKYLEDKGTLIYRIGMILTPLQIELLVYLESVFGKIEIVKPKIETPERQKGFFVYCSEFKKKNYKDDFLEELLKKYPDLKWKHTQKYSELFPEGNYYSNYNNRLYNKNFEYPSLNVSSSKYEIMRKKVLKMNEEYFSNGLFEINAIYELLGREIPYEEKKQYNEKKKFACLDWSKEFNWKLKPNLDFEPFIDEEGLKIVDNIFGDKYLKPQILIYEKGKEKSPETLEKILSIKNRILLAQTVIDTRNIQEYEKIKHETDIYRKNLHPIITKKYNAQAVTQAWQKMYEISSVLPLFKNKNMKTFHACEAPGSFIISFNHYLRTHYDVEWEWKAQSLHPSANKRAFFDHFGLIRNYPDNWDFGDGSGDMTRWNNLQHYIDLCKDVDLITLDCGLPHDERDKKQQILNLSFLYFILVGVPVGSNGLFKMFLDIDEMEVYMLYEMSKTFEKLYFYKPLQNPRSHEIYVLCFNKKETYKNKKLDEMVKNKNLNLSAKDIPKTFLDELYKILNFYVESFEKSIENKIYYLDNLQLMDEFNKNLIEYAIKTTNLLWLKRFPIKKIKNSDKFNIDSRSI